MLGAILAVVLIPAGIAQAHPLGNFTVNHYNGLELYPDRIDVLAVVDIAEIPTAQDLQSLAPDGDPSESQLADAAGTQCKDLSRAVTAAVDGELVVWAIQSSALETKPGAGGLPTLRLICELSGETDLSQPRIIEFTDTYRDDRVGWHEITADGFGVALLDPSVGTISTTDELRTYPIDLLSSPLDQRSVRLSTEPGQNTAERTPLAQSSGDPFSSLIASTDRILQDLIGGELTFLVGTLALVLAFLLGCGHALLPGHGKTMIAAYLAARMGRSRDAVIVGATVTATHTAGVLLLGLAIAVSSTLAGEEVLRWLGIISGLLVAGIGVYMLRTALRARGAARRAPAEHTRTVQPALIAVQGGGVAQGPPTEQQHNHAHDQHEHGSDNDGHSHGRERHDHEHDHDHGRHDHGRHDHGHDASDGHTHGGKWWAGGHSHEPTIGRGGLIGMGVAGGLVPSPSALIVLVASIALGRTIFGVFLVVVYGLGMAVTLTVTGLLLVRLRGRLDRRAARGQRSGASSWLAAIAAGLPMLTATLVLLVGLALVLRGLLLTG